MSRLRQKVSGNSHHREKTAATVPEYNIAMLGCEGTGKSALTVKFLTRRFINEYDPNLEDTYTKEETVDNQPSVVKIMDTAKQEPGSGKNNDRYLRWADAFIVVYSINNRLSFHEARDYLEEVTQQKPTQQQYEPPVIVLGNKTDMERYRQVSKAEGNSIASQYGCSFYEASAAGDYDGVQTVFHGAIREIRRERERNMPLTPLFISEDKSGLPTTGARSPAAKRGGKSKNVQKKTSPGFRFFNISKIF
ncbi:ras-like protein family member 12 [Branchiostoma lanceolatum]|uniref:ras-like protein family member 12 n=1 Tax=Branchiostoma lanceolatum TaxID=7740 RepID=UPI00345419C5